MLFTPPLTGTEKLHKETWKDLWIDGIYRWTLTRTSENQTGPMNGVFNVNALRRRAPDER